MPVGASEPLWLGDPDRPSFAWYHEPQDGRVRAAAVICPPLGNDYVLSHYALRELADRLCPSGFAVVRLDYDGTGDSAGGNDDPDRVRAWIATVRRAIEVVRGIGVGDVCLIGLRFGATLASEVAAEDGRVDQLVLWDPCASGRSFLAEQRALSLLTLGTPPPSVAGSVEILGSVLHGRTVDDLRRLSIADGRGPLARRVLVLTRADRISDPSLWRPTVAREEVERMDADGQEALLDRTAPNQELPVAAMQRMVDWLSRGAAAGSVPSRPPAPRRSAVIEVGTCGERVAETAVRIPPAGLFGIVTQAGCSNGRPSSPAVIMLNVATESHIGPARLWVELARHWARAGIRSLRIDLSGLGDSPHRGGEDGPWACFKAEAFDDVVDAARWMSPEDPSNVVLVGLCSSAYQALEGALALGTRGVVAINPYVSFVPPEHRDGRPLDPRRRIALPKDVIAPVLREGGRLGSLRDRAPDLAWRLRTLRSPGSRSGRWLAELVGHRTDTLIVAGMSEGRPIRQGVTARHLHRLERTGLFRFEQLAGLQHGLLVASQKQLVAQLVSEHVVGRFGGTAQQRNSVRAR